MRKSTICVYTDAKNSNLFHFPSNTGIELVRVFGSLRNLCFLRPIFLFDSKALLYFSSYLLSVGEIGSLILSCCCRILCQMLPSPCCSYTLEMLFMTQHRRKCYLRRKRIFNKILNVSALLLRHYPLCLFLPYYFHFVMSSKQKFMFYRHVEYLLLWTEQGEDDFLWYFYGWSHWCLLRLWCSFPLALRLK